MKTSLNSSSHLFFKRFNEKVLLVLVALISFNQIYAQSDRIDNLRNVVPPSPEAGTLGKYAEWPVNLYTGLANIDIPLHTVKGRTISVPVSVSYHASGNRVGDIASSVGLGWALNAGGAVSRSVRGLPDEQENGYFSFRNKHTNPNDLSSALKPGEIAYQNEARVADGINDAEQDIYTINALGRSYKLMFLGTGEIITNPSSQWKITANFTTNTWTAITEDGTTLTFGGNYFEQTFNPSPNFDLFTSSWQLITIKSIMGENINFTYQLNDGIEQTATFARKDKIKNNQDGVNGHASCSCEGTASQIGSPSNVNQHVGMQLLSSIDSDMERLDFILGPLREDLEGAHAYEKVRVYSKSTGVFTEEYKFITSYSKAVNSTEYKSSDSFKIKRLRLVGIEKKAFNSTDIIFKWSFEYDPKNLPSRISNAQDHWGYFNGKTNNVTFLPALPPVGYFGGFKPENFDSGDREPHTEFMDAEILTSIIYPTGGSTLFEYEPNSYTSTQEGFATSSVTREVTTGIDPFINSKSVQFLVSSEQYITVNFSGLFSELQLRDVGPETPLGGIVITDPQGNELYRQGFKENLLHDRGLTGTASVAIKKSSGSLSFVPGLYTLSVSSMTDFTPSDVDAIDITATVRYQKSTGIQSTVVPVGGVRIKRMTDRAGMGSPPSVRRFIYENALVLNPFIPLDEYVTSISEQTKMSVTQNDGSTVCMYPTWESTCFQEYIIRNAYAKTAVASNPIGYGKVTTLYGETGQNGRMVSVYSNKIDDNVLDALEFPFPPPTSNQWQRGTLLEQTEMDAGQNPLRKTVYNYTALEAPQILTYYKAGRATIYYSYYNDPYSHTGVVQRPFFETTGRQQLTSTTQTEYNGGQQFSTSTNFFYETPANFLATRTEITDSQGKLIKKYSWTPLEKTTIQTQVGSALTPAAATLIDQLVAANRITEPLATEEWRGNTLVTRSLINYKTVGTLLVPDKIMVQNGSGPLEDRVQFTSYDASGNLLQQSKINDVLHSYIWDHNSSYLIADVINAPNPNIAYTSFEGDGKGGWSGIGGPRNADGITGAKSYSLSNGTMTKSSLTQQAYIVSLWAKNGTLQINTIIPSAIRTSNGWSYYELELESNTTAVTISGTATVDEVRLYPKGAQMTTYCYRPLIGTTHVVNPAGSITSYEYDSGNRLLFIKDDQGNIIKSYEYNYQLR